MSSNTLHKKIVILGNGISGITTARHLIKKSNHSITVVSEEHPYFFSRTALMYVYMGHLKFEHIQPYETNFWSQNNIDLIQKRVKKMEAQNQQLLFEDGTVLPYDVLVLACGSIPNKFGWPGQELEAVQGMYHKKDLEMLEGFTQSINTAVVVGGGLIGIELVEMLHSRGKKVHFLVRESSFWNLVLPSEESEMVNQHIRDHGIDLQLATELESLEGNASGRVCSVQTSKQQRLESEWVGLAVGVSPNIGFLKDSGLALGKGIQVNRYLETNLPNVYALGDCAEQLEPQPGRHPIEAVWYTGRIMGETLAQTLSGTKTAYRPGPWFNSAKFFDIEYQTYGTVSPNPNPEKEAHLFWKHPKKNKTLRLSFDPKTHTFMGIVGLGIRLRHECFESWLTQKTPLMKVVEDLDHSFFDPEFTPTHHHEIKSLWNQWQPLETTNQ